MVKTGEIFAEHIITDVYAKKQWGLNGKNKPRTYFLILFFSAIFE